MTRHALTDAGADPSLADLIADVSPRLLEEVALLRREAERAAARAAKAAKAKKPKAAPVPKAVSATAARRRRDLQRDLAAIEHLAGKAEEREPGDDADPEEKAARVVTIREGRTLVELAIASGLYARPAP